jgi:hypothetical protein
MAGGEGKQLHRPTARPRVNNPTGIFNLIR